jgi:hypothetical protein
MDRELVLAILVALFCGGVAFAFGWWPADLCMSASGHDLERASWRRLWLPLLPATVLLAALCGWASVEPARAERVPACLLLAAVPFAVCLARAIIRAVRSLVERPQNLLAGTTGLFRPRVVVSPRLARRLDQRSLAAAIEHERAHRRHFDPLRLWLGQLATDLQWPWPAARSRFRRWTRALEFARDEEARLSGADGADLAAAIVAAIRLGQTTVSPAIATLTGDASVIQERIAHLLEPLDVEVREVRRRFLLIALTALLLASALLLGTEVGEPIVCGLLEISRCVPESVLPFCG